jgi:hypothetical protein
MQLVTLIFAAFIATSPALAFTNGSLVPAYICHPYADGLPKSFGQLLQFTREQTPKVAFSPDGTIFGSMKPDVMKAKPLCSQKECASAGTCQTGQFTDR